MSTRHSQPSLSETALVPERLRVEGSGSPRTWRDLKSSCQQTAGVESSCQQTAGVDVEWLLVECFLLVRMSSTTPGGFDGRVPQQR